MAYIVHMATSSNRQTELVGMGIGPGSHLTLGHADEVTGLVGRHSLGQGQGIGQTWTKRHRGSDTQTPSGSETQRIRDPVDQRASGSETQWIRDPVDQIHRHPVDQRPSGSEPPRTTHSDIHILGI